MKKPCPTECFPDEDSPGFCLLCGHALHRDGLSRIFKMALPNLPDPGNSAGAGVNAAPATKGNTMNTKFDVGTKVKINSGKYRGSTAEVVENVTDGGNLTRNRVKILGDASEGGGLIFSYLDRSLDLAEDKAAPQRKKA